MISKSEKMILKKILENKLTVDHKNMTIEKLEKITDKTENDLYKIINLLLTRSYIKMVHTDFHWTVNEFYITERGLKALETDWYKVIQNFFIGLATIVSILALISSQGT